MDLKRLREEVCEANLGIYRAGLVTMHSGNVSGIDRDSGAVVIKPSGVDYEKLTQEMLVVTDVQGRKLETGCAGDKLNPSVDLSHHLFVYAHCPEVAGVAHTHSNYATSFALLGRSLPVYLTAMADEFGCEIPCAPYTDNSGDNIGKAILRYRNACPAILLANHGVFTFAQTPRAALKTAVMLEDVAKTCHLAVLLGHPTPMSADEARKWYDRYHSIYGQQAKVTGAAGK